MWMQGCQCVFKPATVAFIRSGGKRQSRHALIQSSSHEGTWPHLSLTTVHIKGLAVRMGRWIRLEGRQENKACLLIRAYCWPCPISIPSPSTTCCQNLTWNYEYCILVSSSLLLCIKWSQCQRDHLSWCFCYQHNVWIRCGQWCFLGICVVFLGRPSAASLALRVMASWHSQLGSQLHCCYDRSYDLPCWEGVLAVGHASAVGVCLQQLSWCQW